jgi:hypothetical protein
MTEIKRDVSISMSEASLKATLLVVPLAVLQIVPFFWLHAMQSLAFPAQTDITVFGFLLIFGILAHELIHLFTWMFFAQKPLKAFKLGFQWKSLTPYAHCKEPMDIRAYRIGTFAPGFLLGILPWLVSLFTGDMLLMAFGFTYTTAAGGDFLILWLIRNIKPNTLVEDHPTNAGCYIIEQG